MVVSASRAPVGVPAGSLLSVARGQPLQPSASFPARRLTRSRFYATVRSLIKKGKTSAYTVEDTDVRSNIKAKHFMFQETKATIRAAISCIEWHSHSGVLSRLNICYLITVGVVYAKIYCYLLISVLTQLQYLC